MATIRDFKNLTSPLGKQPYNNTIRQGPGPLGTQEAKNPSAQYRRNNSVKKYENRGMSFIR